MNIKYAFLNLSRKPILTILTILQLITSVMLLYCSLSFSHYISSKTQDMRKIYDNKNLYSIIKGYMPELDGIKTESLENFNKYLKNSSKFNYIFLSEQSQYINIGKNNGAFIKAYATRTINNEDFQLVYDLNVDESFFDKFSFKLDRGQIFSSEDFKVKENEPIPVIIGSSYEKIFKLGDKISYLDYYQNTKLLKVIGFLKKGCKWQVLSMKFRKIISLNKSQLIITNYSVVNN